MWEYYREYVMPLVHLGMEMSQRGVRVDGEALKGVKKEVEEKVRRAKGKFERLVPGGNANSPKQLGELLYGEFGLPCKVHRKTGEATVGKEAIQGLLGARPKLARKGFVKEVLEAILEVRNNVKMYKTYACAKLDPEGRLHTKYLVTGTGTGRLSSKKTDEDEGLNLQNLPPWFRRVIVADPGKRLVEGDGEQAESRIVAYLAGEEEMLAVFADPTRNIHKLCASKIFGIPEEEVVKDSSPTEPYGRAKRISHGLNYMLGIKHAAELAGIPVKEMEKYGKAYYGGFPRITELHRWVEEKAKGNRTLVTPYGRRRLFLGRPVQRVEGGETKVDMDLVRKMVAYIPQSTCTEYVKRGMLKAWKSLPKGAEFLMDNHDGFLMQCWEGDVEEVVELMKRSVCVPLRITDIRGTEREMIIPLKVKVGERWGEGMYEK